MTQEEIDQLSDDDLLKVARQNKPSPIIDAFFIGFLIGIVFFSTVSNTLGFLTLIPLFLIYIFLKKPKRYEILQKELKKRNLS